jgi:glycosyltransferase involved in cell wall biosynthesis
MRVSVIVPVYNPGAHLDECVESLLAQTMPADEHELIFVDDGSTDGSGERLDALAAEHPHVVVRHIPNSGWPGKPRNVGLDMARGEFIYFVDNDDRLGAEALARLCAFADEGDADIVIGKVVVHGRWLPRGIFTANRHGLTAEDAPFGLLTPHKLFRRELLNRHGIRYPEVRSPLEDHPFVVEAYFRARRISVLADYPCYHWVGRGSNASFSAPDPVAYFRRVREVLDIVDAHTEPGPLRDRLYMRWYRGKAVGRVSGRQFKRWDLDYMQTVLDEVRALTLERFPERLDASLNYRDRLRAGLVRGNHLEALAALGAVELGVHEHVRATRARVVDGALELELEASLGDSLPLVRRADGVRWQVPEAIARALGEPELEATEIAERPRLYLLLISPDRLLYELRLPVDAVAQPGERPVPTLRAVARIDPATAAGGAPLDVGRWMVRGDVAFGGFSEIVTVQRGGHPLHIEVSPGGKATAWPSTARRMARSVPGVPAVVRRMRALRSA